MPIRLDAEFVQERNNDAFVLPDESKKQVAVVDERVAILSSQRNAFVECLGGFYRKAISVQHALTYVLRYLIRRQLICCS